MMLSLFALRVDMLTNILQVVAKIFLNIKIAQGGSWSEFYQQTHKDKQKRCNSKVKQGRRFFFCLSRSQKHPAYQ